MSGRALVPHSQRVEQAIDLLGRERKALATITTASEAATVEKRVAAIAELLRRAGATDHAVNEATLVRIEALCIMAVLVDEGQAAGEIATPGENQWSAEVRRTFSDLGIDHRRLAEARKLRDSGAADWLRENLDGGRVAWDGLVKQAMRAAREEKVRVERAKRERSARRRLAKLTDAERCDVGVRDVNVWRPTGIAAIITDPPYIGDALPLYNALRDFAVDVLPPGGALVVMTWQPILSDVFATLRHPDLAYRWTIAWRYATHETTVDHTRRVFDGWKPILVYHRSVMPKDAPMFFDVIDSAGADKTHHEWGQSLDGFSTLVERFSNPGDLICDPFLGGGTTAVAAIEGTRRFIGGDIDATAVRTTKDRVGL